MLSPPLHVCAEASRDAEARCSHTSFPLEHPWKPSNSFKKTAAFSCFVDYLSILQNSSGGTAIGSKSDASTHTLITSIQHGLRTSICTLKIARENSTKAVSATCLQRHVQRSTQNSYRRFTPSPPRSAARNTGGPSHSTRMPPPLLFLPPQALHSLLLYVYLSLETGTCLGPSPLHSSELRPESGAGPSTSDSDSVRAR